jgi:D-alanyl-D-alanine carboxypeptidase/D-alanyl-D-alanine-endopeptidase (penicillin-binding protein 4)
VYYETRRERRGESLWPVFLLIIAAAIPAVGLWALANWADEKIPDASKQDAVITEPRLPAALTTPLLSVRRAPQTLATMASTGALNTALNGLGGAINDGSCLVVQLDGTEIFNKGGDLPVTPASNQKILTAATALEVLGPDYTYTTRLAGTVDAANGTVNGDLYLVGSGDPLLSTAAYPPSVASEPPTDTTALEVLVFNLAAAGVRHVQGNIVGDESKYDTERFVPSWSQDIQNVEAGPLGALLVNDATRQLGTVKRYAEPAVGGATDFLNLLKGAGITVSGKALSGVTPPGTPEITTVTSAPMSTIVAEMLTTSDDNTAEMLLKEIDFKVNGTGTRQGGLEAMKGVLTTWGIDTQALNPIDGSGLDSGDTVSCKLLLAVLTHGPVDGPLALGLPIAGQTGTLATEFTNSAVVGRLHAKTGTLTNAKALTGFVTTTAGTLDVSMVLTGQGISDPAQYQPVWDQLANTIGTYPSGPPVDVLAPR